MKKGLVWEKKKLKPGWQSAPDGGVSRKEKAKVTRTCNLWANSTLSSRQEEKRVKKREGGSRGGKLRGGGERAWGLAPLFNPSHKRPNF